MPCAPSILASLDPTEQCDDLRAIFLGGESPNLEIIRKWSQTGRSIYNAYGPSEITCASLIAKLDCTSRVTLEKPMPQSQILLMDKKLHPSEEGEIWISGPGLAKGYFGDPECTRSKFVDYYSTTFYRTGDFARGSEGELLFLGREDGLIKNRGFFISIEMEIIPALPAQDGVETACAFSFEGKLVSFVTPLSCNHSQLRYAMAARFEPFLVPNLVYSLEQLSLSSNGKVNIQSLRSKLTEIVIPHVYHEGRKPCVMQSTARPKKYLAVVKNLRQALL